MRDVNITHSDKAISHPKLGKVQVIRKTVGPKFDPYAETNYIHENFSVKLGLVDFYKSKRCYIDGNMDLIKKAFLQEQGIDLKTFQAEVMQLEEKEKDYGFKPAHSYGTDTKLNSCAESSGSSENNGVDKRAMGQNLKKEEA